MAVSATENFPMISKRRAKKLLVFVFGFSLLSVCQAQTFRFAHLQWTHCVEGFYDPYFPEVCSSTSATYHRAVGFTLTASWGATDDDPTKMLQTAFTDVRNFVDSNQTVRNLRLYRNRNEKQKAIKIGWRKGQGLDTILPPDGGIVDCPRKPCIGLNNEYILQIDRVSLDRTKVYARYSFEIVFPEDGLYSVYFEGCCRPKEVLNNAMQTFHVRTEVPVHNQPQLPRSSVRFTMPDTVVLRQLTKKVEDMKCSETQMQEMSLCTDAGGCYHKFQVQALHPIAALRNRVNFRLANNYEMGLYKCYERADLADPTSPMQIDSTACEPRVLAAFAAPPGMSLKGDEPGVLEFRIDITGVWQATVVAVCEGCAGLGKDLISVLDFQVRVIKAFGINNWQPPYSYYPGDAKELKNRKPPPPQLIGVTPLATFDDVAFPKIVIQCGRTQFRMSNPLDPSGTLWDREYLRIAFTDDFTAAKAICGQGESQSIENIVQQIDLPKGVTISQMMLVETEQDAASAYVDISWRPQCEDYSQVGPFLMCFQATDKLRRPPFDSFVTLTSYPGLGTSRSCVAVESLPPAQNPAPRFERPTMLRTCSADCCDCCGRPNCNCADNGQCCSAIYATAGDVLELVVRVFDEDPFETVVIYFSGLKPDERQVTLPAGVDYPRALPLKYGCGDEHYNSCNQLAERKATNDAQALLRWDLGAMGLFTCIPRGATAPVKCQGLTDTTTCSGGTECVASDAKKTIAPFKVCYQAGEATRPGVDLALWQRTFGRSPENRSCQVCFMMSVADKPFFIDFDPEFEYNGRKGIGTPFSGKEYNLAVGEELTIELLAAANNAGQVVQISILAEPGAPLGSRLTEQVQLEYDKVTYNTAFMRHFIFTPKIGQEGTSYDVCFQGIDGNKMSSRKKCFHINVLAAQISWVQTSPCPHPVKSSQDVVVCPPDGHLMNVTIGCQYSLKLIAAAPRYSLRIRQQKLPTCEGCAHVTKGGVVACADLGLAGKGSACCGNGMCDGMETSAACPSDCKSDTESLEQHSFGTSSNDWTSIATYKTTPTRGMEGRRLLRCFEGITNAGSADAQDFNNAAVDPRRKSVTAPSFCVVFNVLRCTYCVPQYATMKSLSVHYLLNMDWLRVYNSNPLVPNPDALIEGADTVAVGPLYEVQKGDTLLSVAAMAKTTVKSILQVNSDLAVAAGADHDLLPGHHICLLLCSAMPALQ